MKKKAFKLANNEFSKFRPDKFTQDLDRKDLSLPSKKVLKPM